MERSRIIVLSAATNQVPLENPRETLAHFLFGKRASRLLYNVIVKSTVGAAIAAFAWVAAAVVVTFGHFFEELNGSFGQAVAWIGATSPACYVLLGNTKIIVLLLRTFEFPYMVLLALSTLYGFLSFTKYPPYFAYFSTSSLLFTALLDASPPYVFFSPICYCIIISAVVLTLGMSVFWVTVPSARGIVTESATFEISGIGTMSMFQRFVLSPIATMGYFFFKWSFARRNNLFRTNALRCAVNEVPFQTFKAYQEALKTQCKEIGQEASKVQRGTNGKGHVFTLLPIFRPVLIRPNDTLCRRALGRVKSDNLRGFLRRRKKLFVLSASVLAIIGFSCMLLSLFGLVSPWVSVVAVFFVAPSILLNILFTNVTKVKLLARSIDPIYLWSVSLALSAGMILAFNDLRSLQSVNVLFVALAVSLFDAQKANTREILGGLLFPSGALYTLFLLLGFYLEKFPDVNVIRIYVPGAALSVSNIQLLIIAPCAAMLPFYLRMFVLWGRDRRRLVFIISAMERRVFTDSADLEDFLRDKRKLDIELTGRFVSTSFINKRKARVEPSQKYIEHVDKDEGGAVDASEFTK